MQNQSKYLTVFLLTVIFAATLRLPKLTQRPMHTDEAVHALKFGELLEEGKYHYDPNEYHGPTLNYFTLIPAWLACFSKLTDVTEVTLRIVPVFFGVMIILFLLLLKDGLNWQALIFSALLTAISPAMVFYSRYYIQEMLLVCFTFGAIVSGYRYSQNQKLIWSIFTGLFVGLMNATKETWIIAFGAMIIAGLLVFISSGKNFKLLFRKIKSRLIRHLTIFCVTTFLVSILFYSSFFTNPVGIMDSMRTYTTYFQKAGQNPWHIHPWFYYFKLLIFYRISEGPIWSECLILLLAAIGMIMTFMRKTWHSINWQLARFLTFYSIIMLLIYALIPYKTPWNMLGFLHGLILMAGIGMAILIQMKTKIILKTTVILLLIGGIFHLTGLSYLSNYRYKDDPANPYVYAHTSADIFRMVQRIKDVAKASPEGNDIFIEVICPGDDYWPLPWYLRGFHQVGWWNQVDCDVPAAPLIIASPSVETDLIHKLYAVPPPGQKRLYLPLFDDYVELRPQVELRGYVVKELWDHFQQNSIEK